MSLTPRLDRLEKNYIINSDMRIAQRGTSFVSPVDGVYTLDRYQYGKIGAMTHTVSQDADVPTVAQAGYLFQNSLRLNLTAADTSIAVSDFTSFRQKVEGYNWASLAQKDFTLSFWVKATLTGTYCVSFRNSGNDRSYVAEYTINAINTWEKKTINVPASPATGTWNYTNGVGLAVDFTLAAGTNLQTTAGSWQTGNFIATSNQVNGVNTGATDFRLTGVMLCEGTLDDPEFTTFGKDFESELRACQRYCEVFGAFGTASGRPLGIGSVVAANNNQFVIAFSVKKRANAVVTVSDPTHLQIGNATNNSGGTAFADSGSGVDCARFGVTATSSATNAATILTFNNNAGRIYCIAEL
jgi:hypothetical protein